jgi:hypothetical protein
MLFLKMAINILVLSAYDTAVKYQTPFGNPANLRVAGTEGTTAPGNRIFS